MIVLTIWVLTFALLTHESEHRPTELFSGSLQSLPPTLFLRSVDLTLRPGLPGVMHWVGFSSGPAFQITLGLNSLPISKSHLILTSVPDSWKPCQV